MRFLRHAFLVISSCALLATPVWGQQYPQPEGFVNDFAHLLTDQQAGAINQALITVSQEHSVEIAVVTVPSLDGYDIVDYTRGLGNAWGVGKKGANNGVVFLIAPRERAARIEVASGNYGILSDPMTDDIMQNIIIPHFKAGDMAGGIIDGTQAIIQVFAPTVEISMTSSPAPVERPWTAEDTRWLLLSLLGLSIIIGLIALIVKLINRADDRNTALVLSQEVNYFLSTAEGKLAHPDVKSETRARVDHLRSNFGPYAHLTADVRHVDWRETREALRQLSTESRSIESAIAQDIDFAAKARSEGPKLLANLPAKIRRLRRRMRKKGGDVSSEAEEHLRQAEEAYRQARAQASASNAINWLLLYVLLTRSESHCRSIDSALAPHAPEHHSAWRSSHQQVHSTVNFGHSGGFGGGGFGGGGGSTGRW